MGKFKEAIGHLVDAGYGRGMDGSKMARRLVEAGVTMMRDEADLSADKRAVLIVTTTIGGATQFEWPLPGHKAVFIRNDSEPHNGYSAGEIERLYDAIRDSAEMFDGYAKLHLAKNPPDIDKAKRNAQMAVRLFGLIDELYVPPRIDDTAPNPAVQHDSGVSGAPTPPLADFASGEPLSRSAVLAWLDTKLDSATKHGMRDTYNVLVAMRGELAAHLEEQPIDVEAALRQFYASVHADNVKAGWWTDLATGQPKARSVGEMFMLFVTEISEAYDAYVTAEQDDKLPQYPGLGVELGDLQIRLADFCGALAVGRIVEHSNVRNPGESLFNQVGGIAVGYEAIRKTPEAKGEPEMGDPIEPMDVAVMITEKRAYNAKREDHRIENRRKDGGKVA